MSSSLQHLSCTRFHIFYSVQGMVGRSQSEILDQDRSTQVDGPRMDRVRHPTFGYINLSLKKLASNGAGSVSTGSTFSGTTS